MRIRTAIGLGHLAAAAAAVLAAALVPATASAAPAFAPAAAASVHPGVMTVTGGAQCTANFVFSNGSDVFIGQAAHCASRGATMSCTSQSLPLGTKVKVAGASRPGTLVYSSLIAMQANNESDPNVCAYNDFALVRLDPADVGRTNPTVPFWGGPTGLDGDGTVPGEGVYSYQNSSLRLGLSLLSPKAGTSLGTSSGGWAHTVYTITPGVFGDSGAAFLSSGGQALGVLSTVHITPLPGSSGVGDLARQLAYANANGMPGVRLVPGTRPFGLQSSSLQGLV